MKPMKNLLNAMKLTLAGIALMTVILSGCKRHENDSPEPDIATRISGKYTYSELEVKGKVTPADQTNLKGMVQIARSKESAVNATIDIRQRSTNEAFMVYDLKDVMVSETASGIDLFYESERVAQVKGNKLIINGIDEGDESFTISAIR